MKWNRILNELEDSKDWQTAILYVQGKICNNPSDFMRFVRLNFLLSHIVVCENVTSADKKSMTNALVKYIIYSKTKFAGIPAFEFLTELTLTMIAGHVDDEGLGTSNLKKANVGWNSDYFFEGAGHVLSHISNEVYCPIPLWKPGHMDFVKLENSFNEFGLLGSFILGELKKHSTLTSVSNASRFGISGILPDLSCLRYSSTF